ncbi:type VI secretion system tip protein VgrG [Nocardioides sp.]|uniref:type VI secretion system tip protein VgrG n=1 Tax=Nocardioides sp. TaxID=35761 RepID=UPI0035B083DC
MSDATVIPTPATPDVCSISLLIDGEEISTAFHVLSASVFRELNRIPTASVQLRDGEASQQTFPASNTEHFVPGRPIEIRLGYRGETETVFKGLVVTHRIRVRKNGSLLSLECRDEAIRMTRGRRSRLHLDTTDGDLIDGLIGEYGLQRDVASTKPTLHEVVQYDATDWDFVVCRAEANGHVVAVRDGTVTVRPPSTDASPVVAARFGATVLELDAEIDARHQVPGVTATTWNATDQEVVEVDGSEPSLPNSGNLSPRDLADVLGGDPVVVRHGGGLGDPELQALADAHLLRGRLAKVRGRVRFQGFSGVTAGDVVEVNGIGDRFAGPQLVSGVRHTFANGNWETDVAFGLKPETQLERFQVTALPAAGLLPSVNGLQVGIVLALEGDPDGDDRIQVRLPLVSTGENGVWARVATLDAGAGRGTCFRPELDDEVVVGFLDGDPRRPVVLGQCHSSAKPAPVPGADDNHVKGYVSRSKLKLTFDDDGKVASLETPEGNRLSLSETDKAVTIEDQNGSSITLDAHGITLESSKDIVLKSSGDITLEGGANVTASAQARFTAEGQGGVKVSSSSTTVVKGSLVQIN